MDPFRPTFRRLSRNTSRPRRSVTPLSAIRQTGDNHPMVPMQLEESTRATRTRHVRSPRNRRALTLTILALFALTAACGGDSVGPGGLGSGSITATGTVSTSGSGIAVFQSASSGGSSLFQVAIAPLSQGATVWMLQIASYAGRPPVGTYQLSALSGSSTDPTATFYYGTSGNLQTFNSTSGQLVITSSSPSSVRGTFNFTGTDVGGGSGSVTAHGTFNAPCAPGTTCQ